MKRTKWLFLYIFTNVAASASGAETRAACSQLRQAVKAMRRPYMPNIYNPSSWMSHCNCAKFRSFSNKECFANDEQRYSLVDAFYDCADIDFMNLRIRGIPRSRHTSSEEYCRVLYQDFGGCVTNATELACGPDVARFVLSMWKTQEISNCYQFAD